jgi:hypothetical protein
MKKATATYVAPFGDNKVVEMGGVTFFDGKSVDLNSDEHGALITKLEGNQNFDVTVGKDDEQPVQAAKKRGRPSAKDIAAAKEAAATADDEAKKAAEKAKVAKADADAAVKAAGVPDKTLTPAAQQGAQVGGQPSGIFAPIRA